jgi:hypothetical protein
MAVNAKKNPAAVALGRKGGKKGGPARAAKLTPEQRSESARNAVQARWAKAKGGSVRVPAKKPNVRIEKFDGIRKHIDEVEPAPTAANTSKRALHLCLKRIKEAESEDELRRLTAELQRIVFRRQYQNAENQEAAAVLHETSGRPLS